ncbi:hypothetical protein Dform_00377 [Dehalogenimonas formicexedens]|uniref:Apea-like HEPN domain-containing protein n=1 Tax=Dehalogenimonas formicexedens TaxID=1839801 RepID=A0A1P8F5G5_9CHLR|nr:hypothetical protein [Dehalogenimonas formicexedens]APV43736.1 hypothetical protein Dform_00377 [Dehalogenimonas formicexedens]
MPWIDYQYFVSLWIERCDRNTLDDGDRFINLWIAFNGWMKGLFGENSTDATLITKTKTYAQLEAGFQRLKENADFNRYLISIQKSPIIDMRNDNKIVTFDGNFTTYIDAIYQIRCNLFHGRKDVERDERDKELVSCAYNTLRPLFESVLHSTNGR